jgi:acyl carrier protein
VLASGLRQVVVSPFDPEWIVQRAWRADSPAEAPSATPSDRPPRPRPELPVPYAAPERDAERAVAGIWRELLDVEPVGLDDDFFALGGNSLVVVQLLGRLRQRFATPISAADVFDGPTLRQVAARVDPVTAKAKEEEASVVLSEHIARGGRMREQRLARRVRP